MSNSPSSPSSLVSDNPSEFICEQRGVKPAERSSWGTRQSPEPAGYLALERVQTRLSTETLTALRTAEVRLKSERKPGTGPAGRLTTHTVLRAALQAVVQSGALDHCHGVTDAELASGILDHLTADTRTDTSQH